jgi:ankyrin repeat protein
MDAKELPARPSLEQYRKQAKDLVKSCKSGDPEAMRRAQPHGALRTLADAQFIIAREHGFESWPKFAKHIEALARDNSPVSKYESAADAIVTGDAAALESLLRENPELIRARSTRKHHATLLHYVSANGVEDFRQRTPKNAVKIAEILLEAGAEVDAVAGTYGRGTALGLVATSIHPLRAGVQNALIELLLDHGANVDGAPGNWQPLTAALANGCPQAAELLARRGARVDLVGAAGLGRLDLVKTLHAKATQAQMESAFMWACEYGRTAVIDFLLINGVDVAAQDRNGQTGLHWAVIGGQPDAIQLLLERKAPLETMNSYGGTVLGQALWSAEHGDARIDYGPIVKILIEAGAEVDAALKEDVERLLRRDGPKS